MGNLTQDMTRLCGEITDLRGSRLAFMQGLARQNRESKHQTAGMMAGFRKAHANMATRMRMEQTKFVSDMAADVGHLLTGFRKAHSEMAANTKRDNVKFVTGIAGEVSGLLHGFHHSRATMAKTSKAERNGFIIDLKKSVKGLRADVAADLAGVREAWKGMSSPSRKSRDEADRRARMAAEQRARAAELRAREEAERAARAQAGQTSGEGAASNV
ncbi:MAG: hypothetical protein AB1646_17145 [Thermodesulfobacteriota bacterium]